MNKFIHGDNLPIMQSMDSESIDLIATDPPFDKGKVFKGKDFQFKDIYEDYIEFMRPRLIEMKRLLKPGGSIYWHCDESIVFNLKSLLDEVFGKEHFRSMITWKRTTAKNNVNNYANLSDYIFYYTKSRDFTWNKIYLPYSDTYVKGFNHTDDRGRYRGVDLTSPARCDKTKWWSWKGIERAWCYTKEDLDEMDRKGLIHWPKKPGGIPQRKSYLSEAKGLSLSNIITDICALGSQSNERIGYPTQKPIALYERMIKASTNQGDVVLDPFCGSGTTLVAAAKNNRRWIGIDKNDVEQLIKDRMETKLSKWFDENGEDNGEIRKE